MPRISVSNPGSSRENTGFYPKNFDTGGQLADLITEKNWSPATYTNDYRKKDNFLEASVVALDIDDGLSLNDALAMFQHHKHVIATTKSHQKDKHGVICDRFRVILFLDRPALTVDEMEETLQHLIMTYDFVDKACKDASRFFYPCEQVISVNDEGLLIQVREPQPKPLFSPGAARILSESNYVGKLARSTLDFLVQGAEPGSWNSSLFKASVDFNEQGYTEQEFLEKAEKITGHLDEQDLKTIKSAFNREPRHEPRLVSQPELDILLGNLAPESQTFEGMSRAAGEFIRPSELLEATTAYLSDKDLVKGQPTYLEGLDELLGGGKRLGEVTALCAEGKTGKNAIWHYLMHLWIGKKIPFGYASRELDPATEVLPDYLSMALKKSVRISSESQTLVPAEIEKLDGIVYFSRGRGHFPVQELRSWIENLKSNHGVNYFFFDHLHWCLDDPEDYKAASLLARTLKDIASDLKVHIDVIIQPKVLMEGQKPSLNSMKGGSAIGQNIDNFITLERIGEHKENLSKLSLKAKRSRLAKLGHIVLQYDPESLILSEMMPEAVPQPPDLKLVSIED